MNSVNDFNSLNKDSLQIGSAFIRVHFFALFTWLAHKESCECTPLLGFY